MGMARLNRIMHAQVYDRKFSLKMFTVAVRKMWHWELRAVGRRPCAVGNSTASSDTWVFVKVLAQVHCVNFSKFLPGAGAEFCLPGMKVLN